MQHRPRGLSAYYVNEEERLQEILTDKSVLCLALVSKDNWIRNEQRPHCYYCQRKFRPFLRKHHCRACGEIVCRHCNRHRKVQVGASLEQTVNVRLCFDCIDKAMIEAGKTESHHAASDHDSETPDCNFLNKSLDASSSAVTTSSTVSGVSSSARITNSMASLEVSICESSASGCEYDSLSEAESDDTHKSLRDSTRREQISRTYSNHIEFLPEEAQHEIYEIRRQELLKLYGIMDSDCQTEYDALCELASRALECNVAAVGYIDATRQWYKARLGISQRELPRNIAFCSQLLQSPLPTIIMDASQDPRFSSNPLVAGSASIRFYATTPICDPASGIVIGSVFVMDPKPKRVLPPRAMEILAYLSTAAEKLLLRAKRVDQKQQQYQQRTSDATERRSATTKRKQRVNSAPSIPSSEDFAQQRTAVRAASLQCVPEEFETKENDFSASGISHALPRDKRERELYQLIDPDLLLPHSLLRRNSESKLTPRPSAKFARSSSFTERSSSFSFRSMTSSIFEEDEPEEKEETTVGGGQHPKLSSPSDLTHLEQQYSVAQQPALSSSSGSSDELSGGVAFDLICRITSTQQLLAQQQSAFLETLTQHSSRIGSMEKTMGRIEGIMETLVRNSNGSHGGQQLYEVEI